jgi:hypothetical protein
VACFAPFLPYIFLGSITAATAVSLLWIGFSGELGTAVGGAINLIVFYAGLAISLFLLFQQSDDQRLLTGALLCVAGVLISVGIFLWFRRYPLQDNRPMPLLVRVSFGVFVVLLLLVGSGILLQIPYVFAWELTPPATALFGCFYLGASIYFLYGLVRPSWPRACGQLWAFLAYDLVLIVPWLQRFAKASPEQLPSLIVNVAVLVYSGALAVYYLLVNKATRMWGSSNKAITTYGVDEQREIISGHTSGSRHN